MNTVLMQYYTVLKQLDYHSGYFWKTSVKVEIEFQFRSETADGSDS